MHKFMCAQNYTMVYFVLDPIRLETKQFNFKQWSLSFVSGIRAPVYPMLNRIMYMVIKEHNFKECAIKDLVC